MPEFSPGAAKAAVVQMTNPTGAPFDYTATLYMGVDMVALCTREFSLASEETKDIDFPVTMPSEPGTYPVYFDVWSNSTLIGHYQATEDVVISAEPGEVTFQSMSYPVYPCYQGRTTAEMLVAIPSSVCPSGSALSIRVYIPRDDPSLPQYHCTRPELVYSSHWYLMYAELTSADLTSPDDLYIISNEVELTIRRYCDGILFDDFLPAGTYPLYMSAIVDGEVLSDEHVCDLVISPDVMSSFTYSNVQASRGSYTDTRDLIEFSAVVINSGSATETHQVRIFTKMSGRPWNYNPRQRYDLTLDPGQSAVVTDDQLSRLDDRWYFVCIDDQGSESSTVSA